MLRLSNGLLSTFVSFEDNVNPQCIDFWQSSAVRDDVSRLTGVIESAVNPTNASVHDSAPTMVVIRSSVARQPSDYLIYAEPDAAQPTKPAGVMIRNLLQNRTVYLWMLKKRFRVIANADELCGIIAMAVPKISTSRKISNVPGPLPR